MPPAQFPVTIPVPAEAAGQRLDQFLTTQITDISRARVQQLLQDEKALVNGASAKASYKLRGGEQITVLGDPQPPPLRAIAEDIPLDIVYEDDDLAVVNKPAGMMVHAGAGASEDERNRGTLVNALLHRFARLSDVGGDLRPGIVHRLDKETSGCLVVAKNDETHLALSTQFATRKVEKIYQAIMCGEMPRDQGEIRAAIARHPSHRKRMAVDDDAGRAARTSYRVLERLRGATLAEIILHTGRTHQIRVHFQFIGFPLVGDATYGNRQNQRLAELTHYSAPRQMLHAGQLSFTHPRTARRMSFTAPLPEDFLDALSALR